MLFHILLIIHLLTGTICLISGIFAMSFRKKQGSHTVSGEIYHWSYVLVFITALAMSIGHWETSQYLFWIALFSYGFALMGYAAVKKKRKNWLSVHIRGMLGSYIGLVTAALVVNTANIPVLNEWPALLFWFLPTIIGTPFIVKAVRKYTSKNGTR